LTQVTSSSVGKLRGKRRFTPIPQMPGGQLRVKTKKRVGEGGAQGRNQGFTDLQWGFAKKRRNPHWKPATSPLGTLGLETAIRGRKFRVKKPKRVYRTVKDWADRGRIRKGDSGAQERGHHHSPRRRTARQQKSLKHRTERPGPLGHPEGEYGRKNREILYVHG